ncbi:MAG: hypothetical protein E7034_08865 [Akkermansiaceae bacterium]|nr:hypothetical protein [Akkermansiaceae bacterium]
MEDMPKLPEDNQPVTRRGRKRIVIIIAAALAVLAAIIASVVLICTHRAEQADKQAREERSKAQARERLHQRAADKARRAEEQQMTETGASEPVPVPPTEPIPAPAPLPEPKEEPSPADALPSAPQASEADAQAPEAATEPAPEPTSEAATADTPQPPSPEPQPASEPQQTAPNQSEKKEVHPIDVTNAASFEAGVLRAVEEGQYEMLAESLIPGIRAVSQDLLSGSKLNYAAYRRSDSLMTAVELCVLIKTVGEKQLRELTQGREAGQGKLFMHWMLRDRVRPLRAFIRNFMAQEGDPENMAYSLRTFFEIWKGTPEQERARYLNPAIACSLLSPEVAHSPGLIRVRTPRLSPVQLFHYFREQDRHRRLLTDIKKMSVERLLMVVDVRLPMSEFNWVTKNLDYDRATWAHKAYNSVAYLMERATRDTDPYTTYTFEEILEEGGVCRDQAYFAACSAKVMGIPAVIAVGDGDRGPHAWVVTQVSDTEWKQVNSYGYTTGVFDNPCSGREHHESMLLTRTKRDNPEKFNALADGLVFSRFMVSIGAHAEARGAARYVVGAFPENSAAWDNLVEVMEAENGPVVTPEEWQQIHRRILRQTRKNTELNDLAAYVEDEYLMDEGNAAARKAAMERNIRNMRRNVGDARSDLVVEAINRQAAILSEKGDVRGLLRLYKKELKGFTSRGDVFQELLAQCIMHYSEAEATEREWASLAKEVEKLFERHIRSGGADYFKLSKEVEIQKQLVELYENAGNVKKANRIYQDATRRLERAEGEED